MSNDGAMIWHDLDTTNVEAAIDFYTEVVGWETRTWEGGEHDYTMFLADERKVGGVTELPEQAHQRGAPPHWMSYLRTDDVSRTATRAKNRGGTILSDPVEVPEIGTFAVISDPQGAAFSLFDPADDDLETPERSEPGGIGWHELMTYDADDVWEFYTELFGWEELDRYEMDDSDYRVFGYGGEARGGIWEADEETIERPNWLVYVTVEDLDAAVESCEAAGGEVGRGPVEVPTGDRIARATDPQGALFALREVR